MMTSGKIRSQSRAVAAAVRHLLTETRLNKRPGDRALSLYLREHREIGSRDRRIITEVFYSVCRWWGWLGVLTPKLDNMHEPAWIPLLLSALLMDNLDGPELCRHWLQSLRIHAGTMRTMPPKYGSALRAAWLLERIGGRRSAPPPGPHALVPSWFLRECRCPKPLPVMVDWLQKRPPLWFRIQVSPPEPVIAELEALDLKVHPHSRLHQAVSIGHPRVNLMTLPVFQEGRIEVQDLASQAIGAVCAPRSGQRWWDACAGAGGKTLLLAQLMNGRGTVTASDIQEAKLTETLRRARRAGFSNINTWVWKGKSLPDRKATYDGVLVDAPCSGSGTWRRNPAARWNIEPADIIRMTELQQNLLANAATGLKPGGILVYATCSMFNRENESVVQSFLASHPDFKLEPFNNPLTGDATNGMVQFWPWDDDCDALFAARMRRSAPASHRT